MSRFFGVVKNKNYFLLYSLILGILSKEEHGILKGEKMNTKTSAFKKETGWLPSRYFYSVIMNNPQHQAMLVKAHALLYL